MMKSQSNKLWIVAALALCGVLMVEAIAQESVERADLAVKAAEHAKGTRIEILGETEPKTAELLPKPIMNYADNPRNIHDARMWVYQADGRPAALVKTEYITISGKRQWMWCAASLCAANLQLTMPNQRIWKSSKPGLEWRRLETDVVPGESQTARLRQFKELARRFTSTSRDDLGAGVQEMRLLNQPLYRYSVEREHVVDAALFGLTNNGTNPDLLLFLEAVSTKDQPAEWRWAAAQMTTAELTLRLDGNDVWRGPYVRFSRGLRDQARWMFFSEEP